jgi:hypothetical protein
LTFPFTKNRQRRGSASYCRRWSRYRERPTRKADDDEDGFGPGERRQDADAAERRNLARNAAENADREASAYLRLALADRRLEVESLDSAEFVELEAIASTRIAAVLDEVADRWKDQHRSLSEQERIDRELRRRILSEGAALDQECGTDACGYRNLLHDHFEDYHGLFPCEGCAADAREVLRELQQPLVERLALEPTLEHARALGYELQRRGDGRLVWLGNDDVFGGSGQPYADEEEALQAPVAALV